MATITRDGDTLRVTTTDGYQYRRTNGTWEMLGNSGNWFACDMRDPDLNHATDYENCLRSYTYDESPCYPKLPRGKDIGESIRALQRKELQACTRGIFAPVNLKYDAHAENIARFNREYSKKARGRIISEEEYEAAIAPKRRAARWEAVRRTRTLRILDSVMAA